jgi:hypothetical protein
MQQIAQTGNKPYIPDSQQISMKDLYAFFAVGRMFHDHKPSMKLLDKDELCWISLSSSVMPCDHFFKTLKHLHFADNQNPPVQDR